MNDLSIEKVYKVCDFRPAWGQIFKDYLLDYDYWGHCDIDMVFGDLTYFFEKYELNKYDKFLNAGHLALYRNTPQCNEYYKFPGSKVDYKTVFTSDKHYSFDEFDNINGIYKANNLPLFDDENVYININPWHTRLTQFGYYYKWCNWKYQAFLWENGKVWQVYYKDKKIHKKEYIYIHITHRDYPDLKFDPMNVSGFVFCPDKIVSKNIGEPTLSEIRKWNPYKPFHEFADYIYHGKLQKARGKFRSVSDGNAVIRFFYVNLKRLVHKWQKFD